jgi:hypothetical protein
VCGRCVIKAEPEKDIKDPANPLYNVTIYKRAPDESQGQKTVLAELWASTEIARDEWVDDLNKHAVNSVAAASRPFAFRGSA